ncbi:MAG: hypothetical protein Fur005_09750 [Roseiflexaceae bacterium]
MTGSESLPSIPNYTLESRIGGSNIGEVYRARHTASGMAVAVRLLPSGTASNPAVLERLPGELRAATALRHPHIIEIYATSDQPQTFLVMALAQGGSVRELIQASARSGPLALRVCIAIALQLAEALAYAHQRGVVHHAIRPENVLLLAPMTVHAEPQAVLSDFGLAWLPDVLTGGATVVTSPAAPYLSPEECQGLPYDARSDQYAYGITIYELLTGLPPFPVEILSDAVHQHVFAEPTPIQRQRTDLPDRLAQIVMRCLAKDPSQRYASMDDLVAELATLRQSFSEPVIPTADTNAPTVLGIHGLTPPPNPPSNPPMVGSYDVTPPPTPLPLPTTNDVTVMAPLPSTAEPLPTEPVVAGDATVMAPLPSAAEPLTTEPPASISQPTDVTVFQALPVPLDAPNAKPPETVASEQPTIFAPLQPSVPTSPDRPVATAAKEPETVPPTPVVAPPTGSVAETVPPTPVAAPPTGSVAETVPPTPVATPARPVPAQPPQARPIPAAPEVRQIPNLPALPAAKPRPQVQVFDTTGQLIESYDLSGDGLSVGRIEDPDTDNIILRGEEVMSQHLLIDYDGRQALLNSRDDRAVTQVGTATLRQGVRQVWEPDALVRVGNYWLRLVPAAASSPVAIAGPVILPPPPPPNSGGSRPIVSPVGGNTPVVAGATPIAATPVSSQPVVMAGSPFPTPPPTPIPGAIGQMSIAQAVPRPMAAAAPSTAPVGVPAAGMPMSTQRLRVDLEQDTLSITPGQTAVLRVTLANQGSEVDHLTLEIEGVPETWISMPPPTQLLPGRSQQAALTISVPRVSESYAKTYPVTIYGRSRNSPNEAAVAQAQWTVAPFYDTTLELKPRKAEGWRSAGYTMTLTNGGNLKMRYQLQGEDDAQLLEYELSGEPVDLEAGGVYKKRLVVRGPMVWLGNSQQRAFNLQARTDRKNDQPNVPAQFIQRALIPSWLIPIIMIVVAFLAWWVVQPPVFADPQPSLDPTLQIAGGTAVLKWEVSNASNLNLLIDTTSQPLDPEDRRFVFPDSTAIPTALRLEAVTFFGVRKVVSIPVAMLTPSPIPTPTPVPPPPPPTETPLPPPPPTETPLPPPPPTDVPPPPPPPTATPLPAEQLAKIDCRPGERLQITGSGPASEAFLVYFGRRAVSGGSVGPNGRFVTSLLIGKERPGTYPITVRQRSTDRQLLIQTFQRGSSDPVLLPPTFSDGTQVTIICTVPTATPTATIGP